MKYNNALVILRGQPFHLGHQALVDQALELGDNLIIGLGSDRRARTIRNPFSTRERIEMIREQYPHLTLDNFVPLEDFPYDDARWKDDVSLRVQVKHKGSVVLVGVDSDASSYYLKLFPEWALYLSDLQVKFHAADIRRNLFHDYERNDTWEGMVPERVGDYIKAWKATPEYETLVDERFWYELYWDAWKNTLYPITFMTADMVLEKSNHILMVRRKNLPGKGLLALPGGFLHENLTLWDSARAELNEETGLVLPHNLKYTSHTFDFPHRDLRGRVITEAFHVNLGDDPSLPFVGGSDDAAEAMWVEYRDIVRRRETLYADHFDIIEHFVEGI